VRSVLVQRALATAAALGTLPLLVLNLVRGVNIPDWDEWEWVDLVYAAHTHALTFGQLWEPHNEHRIFVGNALVVALDAAGGWNVVREAIVNIVLLAVTQVILWLLVRRTIVAPRRGVAFFALSILLLALCQEENLYWGFQMPWFTCNLGLFVAVWALTHPRRGSREIAIAAAAAVVASLSSSQGLLVWPAGLVAIFAVGRLDRRVAIGWSLGAVVTIAVARFGIPPSTGVDHVGLGHPLLLAQFGLIYLGAPLLRSFGSGWACVAGGIAVAAFALLAWAALRAAPRLRARLIPWIALAAYAALCGPITGTARAGYGVAIAMSGRYMTISSLMWIAIVAGGFILVPRLALRPRVASALLGVALGLSVVQSIASDEHWRAHAALLRERRDQVAAGNATGLKQLYPDPRRTVTLLRKLAEIRDGPLTR
jgi:hypothetical protein